MFVIRKLRLNKFQSRPIVSNRSLSLSVGERPASITSKETSACLHEPSVVGASKNKVLSLAQTISETAYKHSQGADKDTTKPLNLSQKDL